MAGLILQKPITLPITTAVMRTLLLKAFGSSQSILTFGILATCSTTSISQTQINPALSPGLPKNLRPAKRLGKELGLLDMFLADMTAHRLCLTHQRSSNRSSTAFRQPLLPVSSSAIPMKIRFRYSTTTLHRA